MDLELSIVYIPSEGNIWTAYIAEIPGAVGQGDSQEDAKNNLLSALSEVFEIRRKEDERARLEEFGSIKLHIA